MLDGPGPAFLQDSPIDSSGFFFWWNFFTVLEDAPTKCPLSTRKIQFSNSNLFNFNLISIFSLTLGLFALLIARSKISDVLVSNKSSKGFPVGSKETEDFHSWPRLRYLTLVATNLPHPPARLSITNTTHLHHHFFILCPSADLFNN